MIINSYRYAGGFPNSYSVSFGGSNEYITLGTTIPEIEAVANFSFSAWVKFDSALSTARGIIERPGTSVASQWTNMSIQSTDQPLFVIRNGGASHAYAPALTIDGWYHMVGVFDGAGVGNAARMKIYIDGVNQTLAFTGTIPATTDNSSSNPITMGRYNTTIYAVHLTDEIAVFDYSLSSAQVTEVYDSGNAYDLNDLTTPPVHWWRMGDGDTYATINDIGTGTTYNGTMTNMESGDIQGDVP